MVWGLSKTFYGHFVKTGPFYKQSHQLYLDILDSSKNKTYNKEQKKKKSVDTI